MLAVQVTSKKDQAQYWADASKPYRFMPVKEFADAFAASPLGRRRAEEVEKCCGPPKEPPTPDPLVRTKCATAFSWRMLYSLSMC